LHFLAATRIRFCYSPFDVERKQCIDEEFSLAAGSGITEGIIGSQFKKTLAFSQ